MDVMEEAAAYIERLQNNLIGQIRTHGYPEKLKNSGIAFNNRIDDRETIRRNVDNYVCHTMSKWPVELASKEIFIEDFIGAIIPAKTTSIWWDCNHVTIYYMPVLVSEKKRGERKNHFLIVLKTGPLWYRA